MAADAESPNLQLPCSLCPELFAALSVDIHCSREAYHGLQSKCMKPDTVEMDFDKLGEFMQKLYEEKYDRELCEWKLKSMSEWDAALEEVYVKHFE